MYPGCQRLFIRGFRFRLSLCLTRKLSIIGPREKTSGTQGTVDVTFVREAKVNQGTIEAFHCFPLSSCRIVVF